MRGRGWGRIALVSSGAGGEGWEGAAAYATAKAGLAGLARSLAWELGREGILVNVVAAGLTRTERVRSTGPPEVLEAIASRVPSRQLSEPLESGQALAGVADTLSEARTTGRLARVCQRWIYSSCLCFALDSSEQQVSGFTYTYSVYQAEYSRNLLFRSGATMERVFAAIIDRTRARIDVPVLKTLFGFKSRPHRDRKGGPPRLAAVTETPAYDLTVFKLYFGKLTLKAYTKGEHVLRFEAITHNTSDLRTGRMLDRFCEIVTALAGMLDRLLTVCDCVHASFADDHTLDQLPQPGYLGATRLGGIDINQPRARAALSAALSLAACPAGFTAADFTTKVQAITGDTGYTARQGAYDIRKLRAKNLITPKPRSRRYLTPPDAVRTIAGILILHDQVLIPCLAGIRAPELTPAASQPHPADQHYENLRNQMRALLHDCGLAAA